MSFPYHAVLFDLGYTLIKTDREITMQDTFHTLGVSLNLAELERAYHWTDKYFMRNHPGLLAQSPEVFYADYLRVLLDYLAVEMDPAMLIHDLSQAEAIRGQWQLIDGAKEALEDLRMQGIPLGVVSNWDATAREILRQTGLAELLSVIVISSEEGLEKPDPRIFERALKQLDVSPSKTLYVGDNYYDDVLGARQVGMDAILINRFERCGIEEIDGCAVFTSVAEAMPQLRQTADEWIVSRGGEDR